MSAQHTPGPWITHPWRHNSDDPRWRVIQLGTSSGGDAGLAVVYPRWNAQGATVAANARLIAAAPELLQSLREMLAIVELMSPLDDKEQQQAKDARAAIAKAGGGAA